MYWHAGTARGHPGGASTIEEGGEVDLLASPACDGGEGVSLTTTAGTLDNAGTLTFTSQGQDPGYLAGDLTKKGRSGSTAAASTTAVTALNSGRGYPVGSGAQSTSPTARARSSWKAVLCKGRPPRGRPP